MKFTAIIKKEYKQFVALCPELDIASQGKTIDKALANIKDAVELYIEETGIPKNAGKNRVIVANFEVSKTKSKDL